MNEVREDLKAFVDGELSPSRMAEVQAAVDSDPALQREVEFMRMLGLEIKKLAVEPEVVGKEAAVSKFAKSPPPWWNPATLTGRFAYAGALLLFLAGMGAVLFPVFAQSKQSAKRTAEMSRMKQEQMAMSSGADAGTPAPATEAPAEFEGAGFAAKGRSTLGAGERAFGGSNMPAPQRRAPSTLPGKDTRDESKQTPPTTVVPPSNRMVIKNADITVRVDDAKRAMTEAEALAKGLGGYTEGSQLSRAPGTTPRAMIVLRVPARNYETAMARLREMGDVPYESSNAEDVTAQYADLDGRLRVLRAEEESYVSMLRAARRVGELMEIKDRLSSVRQSIASMESQRKVLANESALSTIRTTFEEKVKVDEEKKEESGFGETWAKAVNGLSAVGEFLGNAAIYLFVFAPIWLPPVLLFWWLGKRAKA